MVRLQIGNLSSVNASMASHRDELRSSIDTMAQKLASAEGRNEYYRHSAICIEMIGRLFEGSAGGAGHHMEEHMRKLVHSKPPPPLRPIWLSLLSYHI
jgi:hypothetical protein